MSVLHFLPGDPVSEKYSPIFPKIVLINGAYFTSLSKIVGVFVGFSVAAAVHETINRLTTRAHVNSTLDILFFLLKITRVFYDVTRSYTI